MRILATYLLLVLLWLPCTATDKEGVRLAMESASSTEKLWPEAPRAWQFSQVAMPVPSLATGAAVFDVPLYELEVGDFILPLSLQYRAGGIRVDDVYQPIGHGWVLSPVMRVTRRILGRPDGDFRCVSDTVRSDYRFFENYDNNYRCAVNLSDAQRGDADRFDTERDVFTVHLVGKSFRMLFDNGRFVSEGNDEYRVETDAGISYIRVTDPAGNVYDFSHGGARTEAGGYQLEWLLSSVTTAAGKEIEFGWRRGTRGSYNQYYGPQTFTYGASMPGIPDYMEEQDFGVPTFIDNSFNIFDIEEIVFPDGKVVMSYEPVRKMMKSLTVENHCGDTVRRVDFTHCVHNEYLKSVKIDGADTYSFEYVDTGDHHASGQDWWGYPNGVKTNYDFLSPAVRLVTPVTAVMPGADRRTDAEHAAHGMLRRAVYPTGAKVEWEYEIHRFAVQESPYLQIPHVADVPLSEGGGVRVKRLVMSDTLPGSTPIVREYVYGSGGDGLARCEAAPLVHTFVRHDRRKNLCYDGIDYIPYEDNIMVVNRMSDYDAYRSGETLIWYPEVREVEAEGSTLHRFGRLCRENSVSYADGKAVPQHLHTVFSTGPVETERIVYDSDGKAVQSVSRRYVLRDSGRRWQNQMFTREYVQTLDRYLSPDFDENRRVEYSYEVGSGINFVVRFAVIECSYWNYTAWPYLIYGQTEQLVSETSTQHTPTGDIVRTTEYDYVDGTSLPARITVRAGTDSLVTVYRYADCSEPVAGQMREANAVGIVTGTTETFRGCTVTSRSDMSRQGTCFRPLRVRHTRGDGEAWSDVRYEWNADGTMAARIGDDGVATRWTWDVYGRYPSGVTLADRLVTRAEWKPLVGISSLTGPDSVRQDFAYDSRGRLASMKSSGDLLEEYSCRTWQDGMNYVRTLRYSGMKDYTATTDHYDGMGRLRCSYTDGAEGGGVAVLVEYDAMGRRSRVWSPAHVSGWYDPEPSGIKASAKAYHGDDEPYTEEIYEASPRGMLVERRHAGSLCHRAAGATVAVYANDARKYSCVRYKAESNAVKAAGLWPAGMLTVTVETDEDGVATETYTDMRGHTVCEKRAGNATYYVYDGYGDLRFILPPELEGTHKRGDGDMHELAFQYDYDRRGLCIRAKEPGRRAALMAYDSGGRLVAEQSAGHAADRCRHYFYDACGRRVLAVDAYIAGSAALAAEQPVRVATFTGTGVYAGYSVSPSPGLADATVVWARYYDNHDFVAVSDSPESLEFIDPGKVSLSDRLSLVDVGLNLDIVRLGSSAGKLTGVYTGAGYEAYYYNRYGLEGQRCAMGFNRGRRTTYYTYDRMPRKTVYRYDGQPGLNDRDVLYEYDRARRLVRTSVVDKVELVAAIGDSITGILRPSPRLLLAGDTAVMTVRYDEAGRAVEFGMGSARRTQSYECNGRPVRSLTAAADGVTLSDRLIYRASGRVSSRESDGHTYSYGYTPEGFLSEAVSSVQQPTRPVNRGQQTQDFSACYEYDSRGNMLSLTRRGVVDVTPSGAACYGESDRILAEYEGNRLTMLHMSSESSPFSSRTGLGQNGRASLEYDDSGRLIADDSRGIVLIEYDNDDRPVRTVFASGREQHDSWDGLGNHLCTWYCRALGRHTVTKGIRRYTGDGHVLRCGAGDTLEMARFPGGFMDALGRPRYYVSDYRGSVKAVLGPTGSVEQRVDYYPYGEPWVEPYGVSRNRFLFGGKERLTTDGLNEYDQTARRYVASFPRFTTPDAHAGVTPWLSPYAFCGSDPINAIDPTGNDSVSVTRTNGIWSIAGTSKAPGDDIITAFDADAGHGASHIYSQGSYGERVLALNLEVTEHYSIGVMHVSGEGRGGTFLYVTPGGESSNRPGSGKRINDGAYPIESPTSGAKWQKPGLGGDVAVRGIRFHYGKNNLMDWTEGCFVLMNNYAVDGGEIYAKPEKNTMQLSRDFDKLLGASKHYNYITNKKRQRDGSVFPSAINKTFYIRTY